MPSSPLHAPVVAWYAEAARDLPWRAAGTSPWAVLVSEVMLQQTPVARVEPVWREWLDRWPDPAALAAEPAGEAVRAWGRLGYPRRALRLHQAATAMVERHGGEVPSSYDELRGLAGVGDYTASAVLAFAYSQRCTVLDTNVRRVLGRVLYAAQHPPPTLSSAERRRAEDLLPDDPALAARWSVGLMELGALVCTARAPQCGACPLAEWCAWREEGYPPYDGPPRRGQAYEGTDRQARGRILAVLRLADEPVTEPVLLTAASSDPAQAGRTLASLLTDGLVVPDPAGFRLP
jgi:A/G-specific adenine glycosylase